MSALSQYDTSVSPSFNTLLKQMLKYAMIRVNLEAFSMESAADADVKYDGYHSVIQRVMIKTSFAMHDLDNDLIENYDSTKAATATYKIKIENDVFNLYAIQTFD